MKTSVTSLVVVLAAMTYGAVADAVTLQPVLGELHCDALPNKNRDAFSVGDFRGVYGPTTLMLLNELEWINGEIWANIWTEDRIARIRPDTGEVTAFVDLTGILPHAFRLQYPEIDVLNGIAWDPDGHRILVTGKKWPKLFEIKLVEP